MAANLTPGLRAPAAPRPGSERSPSRRCQHCRDWIAPERLVRLPEATECRECADELRRGVIRP